MQRRVVMSTSCWDRERARGIANDAGAPE
jgi:hypothetical protein